MDEGAALLAGLVDRDPPCVGADEVDGVHGAAIHAWQGLGFVGRDPVANPVPTCPHCGFGVPYRLGGRLLCASCRGDVDPRHLVLWPVDRGRLLAWLAGELGLRGGVRQLDARLWQLGTWAGDGDTVECFYLGPGLLSEEAAGRVTAYRRALLLHGPRRPSAADGLPARALSLLAVLRSALPPEVGPLGPLLRDRGAVRLEAHSGALWVGERWLGEVPPGTKEYFLLACLARDLDRFVPYSALKREVLRRSGSMDATDEATFCQGLKSRIKRKWVPAIDRVIALTHKGDGFRLRAYAEIP